MDPPWEEPGSGKTRVEEDLLSRWGKTRVEVDQARVGEDPREVRILRKLKKSKNYFRANTIREIMVFSDKLRASRIPQQNVKIWMDIF